MTQTGRARTSFTEWLAAALAGGTLLVGVTGIAGWSGHSLALVQWVPQTPQMPFNTALGFGLVGLGLLLSLQRATRWARVLGGLIVALGLVNYLQFVLQTSFGIDQLWQRQDLSVDRLYPGRTSPASSLAFMLVGGALLADGPALRRSWRVLLLWLAGGCLTLLATMVTLGYLLHWIRVLEWNREVGMSIPAALCTLMSGGAVLLVTWNEAKASPPSLATPAAVTGRSLRVPTLLGLGFFLLTLLLCRGWAQQEFRLLRDGSRAATRIAHEAIVHNWDTDLNQLATLAEHTPGIESLPRWEITAQVYIDHFPTLQALLLTDADARVVGAAPAKLGPLLDKRNLGFEQNRRAAIERARQSGRPTLSPTVELLSGGRGIVAFIPVKDAAGQVTGFIEGVYRLDRMFAQILPDNLLADNSLTITEQDRTIFTNSPTVDYNANLTGEAHINLSGVDWVLRLQPSTEHLERVRSPIPEILLFTGLGTSVLLALVAHFAGSAHVRSLALEATNRRLQTVAQERELAAETFRAQSDLLTSLFENMADGVIVINAENHITMMNPAARALFGDLDATQAPEPRAAQIRQADGSSPVPTHQLPSVRVLAGEAIDREVLCVVNAMHPAGCYFAISGRPLRDPAGAVTGAVLVYTDITEQRQAAELLRRQNELLEERVTDRTRELTRSNEELEQFAYVASHDLQEPLRVVASYLQLLERRYHDQLDQDAHEFIDFAVTAAGRMRIMINDLLQFSRLNRAPPTRAVIDLQAVVDQAVAQLQAQIAETGATVVYQNLPKVAGDGIKLAQLFQNLIGNGIKFHGAEPPRVTIDHRRTAEGWEIAVRDNGIGFDPKYADKIFIIFKRLHGPATYPGSGIGLASCRKIVEQHGGRIWVESTPGRGSAFFFTLPQQPGEHSHGAA